VRRIALVACHAGVLCAARISRPSSVHRPRDAARGVCRMRSARVGMKLFLLPAGAYRELIIPNYLESMYLAKLPKSLHPPNNIMRELKMKLRGHGRADGRAGINSRSNYRYRVAICLDFNGNRNFFEIIVSTCHQ
jgi:hypothetical protein